MNRPFIQPVGAKVLGKPVLRREDARMLTGGGTFTDDIRLPHMSYGTVLRSPHGHARIRSIDTSGATTIPGVIGVLTHTDLAGKVGDIRPNWVVGNSIVPSHPPLASDRVRYLGEPVAFIVAETRELAYNALEAIDVDYEPLPAVVDQEAALRPDAPQLHDNVPGNLIGVFKLKGGDYAAAAARAERIVAVRLVNQRLIPCALEPRAICAQYDRQQERLAIYLPSRVPHMSKRWLAETLRWPSIPPPRNWRMSSSTNSPPWLGRWLLRRLRQLRKRRRTPPRSEPGAARARCAASSQFCLVEKRKRAPRRVMMLSRIGNLTNQMNPPPDMFVAVSGEAPGSGDIRVRVRGGLSPQAFRRVRDYILAHLGENIRNSVLAELAGLSACHFVRAFKQSAGVTPHRFVMQSRVERVKHLLVETNLPLTQVAAITGFADQSHFTRQFRALVGITPRRFRRPLRQATRSSITYCGRPPAAG